MLFFIIQFLGQADCEVLEQASKMTKSCVFPFVYKGEERNGCITEDEEAEVNQRDANSDDAANAAAAAAAVVDEGDDDNEGDDDDDDDEGDDDDEDDEGDDDDDDDEGDDEDEDEKRMKNVKLWCPTDNNGEESRFINLHKTY